MAVVDVNLLFEGRRGRDGIDRKQGYVRRYEVMSDNKEDDEDIVAGEEARAKGLPGNGYPLKPGSAARVVDIQAVGDDQTPLRWIVDCVYDVAVPPELAAESLTFDPATGDSMATPTAPGPDGAPGQQREQNPILWPVKYRVVYEQSQEPATHDLDGDPITNSAGDPYFPPIMVDVLRPVVCFEKYYAFVKIDWLAQYVDSVNLDPWLGRPRRNGRMSIEWESDTVNNIAVWRVSFRVRLKPRDAWNGGPNDIGQGWDLRIPDRGYREYVLDLVADPTGNTFKKVPITPKANQAGERQAGPFPLNGEGGALEMGPDVTPKYVTWRYFAEEDWSVLGL